MSKLDELIRELCPDGVEYKELPELFNTRNGYTPSKSKPEFWTDGTVPWFRMEDIRGNGNILSDASQYVARAAVKGDLFPADSIIVATSATIGVHALITVPSLANQRFTYLMLKDKYKKSFNIRFIYYYCYKLDEYCKANLNQGNFASVDMKKFAKFRFPVPPLAVQEEIVRILDTFTTLTAELQAELQARKKQYEYYRNELLHFGTETPTMTLGEIGPVCMCKRIMKAQTNTEGGVPFYKIGTFGKEPNAYISQETFEEYKQKYNFPKKGDILISAAGTIGRTVVYDGEPAYFQDSNIVWIDNDETKVLNAFLIYCYAMKPWKISEGGTIPRLYNDNILNAVIPVPTLEQQRMIIDTLARFDTLCNDISAGLPAEIEARQRQYEYYRDKLLTFKELS